MIQVDVLKKKVYTEIQEIAENSGGLCLSKIEDEISQYIPEATLRLQKELIRIYEKYKVFQETNMTGTLEWIYISFLRTALLDHSACYRIDFYDSRGCICEVDCAGTLDIPEIFESYYKTTEQMMARIRQQSYLKTYEIQGIIYNLAESYRKLADYLLIQSVHTIESELAEMVLSGKRLRIMLGDFLDYGELIAEINL